MRTLEEAPFVDILSEEFQADPVPLVEGARAVSWLARTPIGAIVLGREYVQALLTDRRLRSSVLEFLGIQGVFDGELRNRLSHSLLALEGDDHTRLRRLVGKAFTPRSVETFRPSMRSTLDNLLDPVVAQGSCEFMSDIADHYPISVMCELLGVPTEDHENFAAWNKAITWVLSFNLAEHRAEAEWGMQHMMEYTRGLVAERRIAPRDDLVTALVQAEEEGDRLSDEELLSMIGSLLFAGFDTTQHPEQWVMLAGDPSIAPAAVEEVMRYRGVVGIAPRFVIEDIDLGGYHIPAGTLLALSTSAANHDPSAFTTPEIFDITVPREPQLTFGGGPHYCLGASLARAEMQEALPLLARRMPGLQLDGDTTWRPPMGISGPESLPLRFDR
jgi:cytochrome P450